MRRFRQTLFWLHLAAGLLAGGVIGIMCFTGAALAFEKQLVAWAERDVRRVPPPAPDAAYLPLAELSKRVAEARPDARPSAITLSRDPHDAAVFAFGRDRALYVNPYTGQVRTPASTQVRDFLHVLEDWHRVLAMGGDNRPLGKAINGACNVAFCLLALSGLCLWWPRSWSWTGLKTVAVFNWQLTGKARDWNWHNTIGLWSAPILLVLTLTAMPISYRWAGNLVYRLVGEEPPPPPGQGATPPVRGGAPPSRDASPRPPSELESPAPVARPLTHDALVARVQQQFPRWETITLRLANPQRGDTQNDNGRRVAQSVAVVIKEPGTWPRTAATTLILDPYTGESLQIEAFAHLSTGRQIRGWMRFLHTGEALGIGGQLVAGLASLGGCFLVYTGFALAWRRFFPKRTNIVAPVIR